MNQSLLEVLDGISWNKWVLAILSCLTSYILMIMSYHMFLWSCLIISPPKKSKICDCSTSQTGCGGRDDEDQICKLCSFWMEGVILVGWLVVGVILVGNLTYLPLMRGGDILPKIFVWEQNFSNEAPADETLFGKILVENCFVLCWASLVGIGATSVWDSVFFFPFFFNFWLTF